MVPLEWMQELSFEWSHFCLYNVWFRNTNLCVKIIYHIQTFTVKCTVTKCMEIVWNCKAHWYSVLLSGAAQSIHVFSLGFRTWYVYILLLQEYCACRLFSYCCCFLTACGIQVVFWQTGWFRIWWVWIYSISV